MSEPRPYERLEFGFGDPPDNIDTGVFECEAATNIHASNDYLEVAEWNIATKASYNVIERLACS